MLRPVFICHKEPSIVWKHVVRPLLEVLVPGPSTQSEESQHNDLDSTGGEHREENELASRLIREVLLVEDECTTPHDHH